MNELKEEWTWHAGLAKSDWVNRRCGPVKFNMDAIQSIPKEVIRNVYYPRVCDKIMKSDNNFKKEDRMSFRYLEDKITDVSFEMESWLGEGKLLEKGKASTQLVKWNNIKSLLDEIESIRERIDEKLSEEQGKN